MVSLILIVSFGTHSERRRRNHRRGSGVQECNQREADRRGADVKRMMH